MIIALASQFHLYLPWGQRLFSIVKCEPKWNRWIVCSSSDWPVVDGGQEGVEDTGAGDQPRQHQGLRTGGPSNTALEQASYFTLPHWRHSWRSVLKKASKVVLISTGSMSCSLAHSRGVGRLTRRMYHLLKSNDKLPGASSLAHQVRHWDTCHILLPHMDHGETVGPT